MQFCNVDQRWGVLAVSVLGGGWGVHTFYLLTTSMSPGFKLNKCITINNKTKSKWTLTMIIYGLIKNICSYRMKNRTETHLFISNHILHILHSNCKSVFENPGAADLHQTRKKNLHWPFCMLTLIHTLEGLHPTPARYRICCSWTDERRSKVRTWFCEKEWRNYTFKAFLLQELGYLSFFCFLQRQCFLPPPFFKLTQ